jgi:hypothetical protein
MCTLLDSKLMRKLTELNQYNEQVENSDKIRYAEYTAQ